MTYLGRPDKMISKTGCINVNEYQENWKMTSKKAWSLPYQISKYHQIFIYFISLQKLIQYWKINKETTKTTTGKNLVYDRGNYK